MPADFGFIAHPAQRNAHELASRCMPDGHGQRSLAHSRRPHEAQNRALRILHQLANRQKLQDPFLNFFEAIVLFVQNLFRSLNVSDFFRPLFPGHCEQPIQIIPADRGLRGHRRHELQPLQLLNGLLVDFLGHPGGVDLLFQLVDFALFAAAQFFLNGLELFVQVVLFLRALHLALHARINVAVDVELLEFDFQDVRDAVQPFERINRLE